MPTAEEIKAAQEKAEQDKKAEEAAAEAKKEEEKKAAEEAVNRVETKDGKVILTQEMYDNLVKMKEDMITYKEKTRTYEAMIEEKKTADEKAAEEKLIADGKLEEAIKLKDEKIEKMKTDRENDEVVSALTIKLIEAGIKSEYVKLIDKSKVTKDGESGEISGIDEIVAAFVKDHPELVQEKTTTPVDTTKGGSGSGKMTDDEVRNIPGKELIRLKKEDPVLFQRWQELARKGSSSPLAPN